jgi:hypothetical protein
VVQAVAELVEQGLDLAVREQRRLVATGGVKLQTM